LIAIKQSHVVQCIHLEKYLIQMLQLLSLLASYYGSIGIISGRILSISSFSQLQLQQNPHLIHVNTIISEAPISIRCLFLVMTAPHNKDNSNNQKDTSHHYHSNNPRKILIVDDEPDITSTFDMILEMDGFEVDSYNDPLLTLSNFKPNTYGLALLDIRMPKMDGFELYKKIRDIDSKIEVCFITAFEDYREEFKESFPKLEEAKYFIRKPKAVEDLVKHVATILG
jgi:two-component system response regulator ChvI